MREGVEAGTDEDVAADEPERGGQAQRRDAAQQERTARMPDHSMALPSAGPAATPPIIEAAMTSAPARRARGAARCSQGSPVGKIGAMNRPTPA